MPREARIDLPGYFYHIFSRGIEQREIFLEPADYSDLCDRLEEALPKYQIQCLAWALMPNHFHLFIRAGPFGIAPFMRSFLTGYAGRFNNKYRRSGHLFQNRYKAVLCEKDPYFLQLVRYIHLNPLRAGIVKSLDELALHPWAGHAALLGHKKIFWQDIEAVLNEFGSSPNRARENYRLFVEAGWFENQGKSLARKLDHILREQEKTQDRPEQLRAAKEGILGSKDFRDRILVQSERQEDIGDKLRRQHFGLQELTSLVAQKFELPIDVLTTRGRRRDVSEAKSVLIYLGHIYLLKSCQELARWTKMSLPAASKARWRGKAINEQTARIDFRDVESQKVN